MDRRVFLQWCGVSAVSALTGLNSGCRGHQYAHVLKGSDKDMVGSHTAGAETWEPLVHECASQLLAKEMDSIQLTSHDGMPCKKRIGFLSVENRGAEDLGDFGDAIYEKIDKFITDSDAFEVVNVRAIHAGLQQAGIRPEDLFTPKGRKRFAAIMEQENVPIDYVLYAKITTTSTESNGKDTQRGYTLSLDLVNLETGKTVKESAELRKGYHKSRLGKLRHYGAG